MIPFNKAPVVGTESSMIAQALEQTKMSGDGPFNLKCQRWFENNFNTPLALLTPSCTAALEMAAILIDVQAGDEVIMPSYTFVSTANAFVLRGAKIVFVDIDPLTMNLDVDKIAAAITSKTRAIVPVHYAGVTCDMNAIMSLANERSIWVIEDAAQGVMSTYHGKALGTLGHIGCFSFHDTKNYTAGGEGGAILVQDPSLLERAEIIREKGTDRSQFFKGQVDKYTWQDVGSSFLLSDIQAAYLYAQLEQAHIVNEHRLSLWNQYYKNLQPLVETGDVALPYVPNETVHNAHMFYIKLRNINERQALIEYLKSHQVISVFHYIPLHSSPAGQKFGFFHGDDVHTTKESERLLRLPMYYSLTGEQVSVVTNLIHEFFAKENC